MPINNHMVTKERKTEDWRRKIESRRQRKLNTGKGRLKRIGSEKTKMKKCMFHLENRKKQKKEENDRSETQVCTIYLCWGWRCPTDRKEHIHVLALSSLSFPEKDLPFSVSCS